MISRTLSVGTALAVGTVLAGSALAQAQDDAPSASAPASVQSTVDATQLTEPRGGAVVVTVVKKVKVKAKPARVVPVTAAPVAVAADRSTSGTHTPSHKPEHATKGDDRAEHADDDADRARRGPTTTTEPGEDHDDDHGDDGDDDGSEPDDD